MVLQRLFACAVAGSLLGGWAAAQEVGLAPAENPPQIVARLQAHYRAALAELTAADTSHLSDAQRAGRARALAELAAYCERGVFGINRAPDTQREANFVDAGGRLCAVANLMARAGQHPLVEQVAATANHAYVVELAGNPALLAWLDSVGLTVAEAARIQAPSSHAPDPEPAPTPPTALPKGAMAGALGNLASGAGASHAATSPSGSAGPNSGAGDRGAGSTALRGDNRNRGATSRGQSGRNENVRSGAVWDPDGTEDGWWLWWEMNKLRFLVPNRLGSEGSASALVTRGPGGGALGADPAAFGSALSYSLAAEARSELLPLLLSLTQADDAMLRARAAVTLGRLGGRQAVEPLTALLSDSQMLVRHAAILGLGATGAMEAAPTLLHLATDGSLPGGDGQQLSSWTRPLACVALGLGRRHGMSSVLDGFVAELAATGASERAELGTAALLYQTLSPCEELAEFALSTLDDDEADALLRCRATETVGLVGDAAQLARMTHLLGDGQVEVRRSAALAMSGLSHPLALAALKTAYELEDEPQARGFLLLSVAEQGGEGASEFLIRAARGGPQANRPWAALALGLLARSLSESGELTAAATTAESAESAESAEYAEICAVLRQGLASDVNHAARGAWILAAGIARDVECAPGLRDAMIGSKDQRLRMFSALALGMIGDTESRPLMLEQLRLEDAPLAIIGLTQALGAFGLEADGPALVAAVHEMRVPATQALLAVALAFHGSDAALSGLMDIARDEQASSDARAAAVDGLGLLLDRQPGLMLQEVAASANFYAFPDWVNGMLTSFTL